MGFKEDTKALNRMTVQTVGELLGLHLRLRGMSHCPFLDHDDSTPSFEIKNCGTRWECYGCNRRGGSIDLVKIYHGTDFSKAKAWLMNRTGLAPSSTASLRVRRNLVAPLNPSTQSSNDTVESPPDHEVYKAVLLHTPLQSSGREYLVGRGLSEETISNFHVGQLSNRNNLLRELICSFGYRRIKAAGLLTKQSTAQNTRLLFPEDSIVFPFFENDLPVYLQARVIVGTVNRGKWRNLNDRRSRLYNIDALFETGRSHLAICEGVIDTLSATELGFRAIGLMGVNAQFGDEQVKQLRGKEVAILTDWDAPGERRAIELQKQLRRFGITSIRKRRPSSSAIDLNDYLMEKKRL